MSEQNSAKASNTQQLHQLLNFLIQVPTFLVAVPVTFALGIASLRLFNQIIRLAGQQGPIAIVLVVLCCPIFLLVVTAIHELGHAFAALCVRWQILQIRVGSFVFIRQNGKFSLRLTSKRSTQDAFVTATPTDLGSYSIRAFIFCSGGMLANFLVALLCLFFLHSQTGILDDFDRDGVLTILRKLTTADDWATTFLKVTVLLNLGLLFLSLIPMSILPLPSDGKQLIGYLVSWMLGDAPPAFARPGLGGVVFHGVRPREWDEDYLDRLQRTAENTEQRVMAEFFEYFHALDHGDVERAGGHLDRALLFANEVQGNDRSAIFLEAAYFEGFHRLNPVVARKWLHNVKVNHLLEYTFLRGAAAVLFAEGLYVDAAESARSALKQIKQSTDIGGAKAEKDWLEAIIDACVMRIEQEET
jgi:hypothetical protein